MSYKEVKTTESQIAKKDVVKMDEKKNKNLGYYLGQALGIVLVGCLAAISIALTYKIIMWIL